MASTILKRALKFTPINSPLFTRAYRAAEGNNLHSRISPLGDPNLSLVPVLDQWIQEGKKCTVFELQRVVRDLRARRRFKHALQVSEWMSSNGLPFSVSDSAVRLDLISKVNGLEAAETYFNSLNGEYKIDKVYGALLSCYVREGLVDKSLAHLQKMKELGFASAFNYNDLMCLYRHTGQFEKIPHVLSDMKENGVSPDSFSYRICMRACGARSDSSSMEHILEEMENQPHITMDWLTYSTVASVYIKAGLIEKSLIYLKKCEEKVSKDAVGYNHLILLYATLGNKDEMMRLWGLQKSNSKKLINRDYITMLDSLVKIGELEESEKLFKEWDSSCQTYDFRVPNILLTGFSRRGFIEKAEAMLRDIVKKGKTPTPNSWAIVAAGYLDKQNMERAFECIKEALAVHEENKPWRPRPSLISSILSWLGDNRDADEVEAFVISLKYKVPESREVYLALRNSYTRSGKEVDQLLESMKAIM
ncbi:pentatricopeptide repeat-containing protein At4g21705, mitochondrial-like [Mangifera indica]|uniref:pentatricopeptide repeat-containing protein At4g21705, mitochondrial-like n=1 Tax=Mangifera indica TaxID=29780 RepID=UPI001CFAFFB6|nr:pentatricopeptide repeat-containing protein At4g21705, mitochondrial-like [Mangifera indica]